ncbi:MAG TPA: DUF4961 domain-containing protein [Puia sp.]|nr:DUF4961 domain-containing protein [Puia sp.]
MKKITLPINKKSWSWIWKVAGTVIIIVIISCNLTISTVDQPASAPGGSIVPITLHCTITSNNPQTSALVVGILVPKIWNASGNTTVTFTADQTTGPQAMSLIPPNTPSPYGNGLSWQDDMLATIGHAGNLIPEYEWIAFQSNSQYTIAANTTESVTVNIQIKVPNNNVLFNMAYVLAESSDGLHSTAYNNPSTSYYGTFFPPTPLRITGSGTLLDFVNPQLSVVVPGSSLDNDIITIPFNANASVNGLSSANQVYLCATGYTHTKDSIKVCEQTARTRLVSTGQGQWQTNIWPRGFFNLSPTQVLDSMEYYFTDATGATRVGYGGKATPFSFTFSCQ